MLPPAGGALSAVRPTFSKPVVLPGSGTEAAATVAPNGQQLLPPLTAQHSNVLQPQSPGTSDHKPDGTGHTNGSGATAPQGAAAHGNSNANNVGAAPSGAAAGTAAATNLQPPPAPTTRGPDFLFSSLASTCTCLAAELLPAYAFSQVLTRTLAWTTVLQNTDGLRDVLRRLKYGSAADVQGIDEPENNPGSWLAGIHTLDDPSVDGLRMLHQTPPIANAIWMKCSPFASLLRGRGTESLPSRGTKRSREEFEPEVIVSQRTLQSSNVDWLSMLARALTDRAAHACEPTTTALEDGEPLDRNAKRRRVHSSTRCAAALVASGVAFVILIDVACSLAWGVAN